VRRILSAILITLVVGLLMVMPPGKKLLGPGTALADPPTQWGAANQCGQRRLFRRRAG